MLPLWQNHPKVLDQLDAVGLPSTEMIKSVEALFVDADPGIGPDESLHKAMQACSYDSIHYYDHRLNLAFDIADDDPSPELDLEALFESGKGIEWPLDGQGLVAKELFQPSEMRRKSLALMKARSLARGDGRFLVDFFNVGEGLEDVIFEQAPGLDAYRTVVDGVDPRVAKRVSDYLWGSHPDLCKRLQDEHINDEDEPSVLLRVENMLRKYSAAVILDDEPGWMEYKDAYIILNAPLREDPAKSLYVWVYLRDNTGYLEILTVNADLWLTAAVMDEDGHFEPCAILNGYYATQMTGDEDWVENKRFVSDFDMLNGDRADFAFRCVSAVEAHFMTGDGRNGSSSDVNQYGLAKRSGGFAYLLTHGVAIDEAYDKSSILQQIVDLLKSEEIRRPAFQVSANPDDLRGGRGRKGNHDEFLVLHPIVVHVYVESPENQQAFEGIDTTCQREEVRFHIEPIAQADDEEAGILQEAVG